MSTSTPDEINIKKLRNRPGNPLACDNWIESLYSIAAVRYGQHASFFITGKLFLMVEPVPRAGLDEMATTSAAWKLHNSRIEAFVKWERDSSDVAAKLFGLMWQNLSAESQTLVARVPPATGWTKKKLAMDPVELLKRIKISHQAGDHVLSIINEHIVFQSYINTKQYHNENPHDFKNRFDAALRAMELVDHPTKILGPTQACDFFTHIS